MTYHYDLKKQGDLRNSLVLLGVTLLWHVAQWVSRAPPHHTLSAFLNLNGRCKSEKIRGQISFSASKNTFHRSVAVKRHLQFISSLLNLLKFNHTVLSTGPLFIKSYPYLFTFCMKKYPIGVRLIFFFKLMKIIMKIYAYHLA